jgi:hypothetical protein
LGLRLTKYKPPFYNKYLDRYIYIFLTKIFESSFEAPILTNTKTSIHKFFNNPLWKQVLGLKPYMAWVVNKFFAFTRQETKQIDKFWNFKAKLHIKHLQAIRNKKLSRSWWNFKLQKIFYESFVLLWLHIYYLKFKGLTQIEN